MMFQVLVAAIVATKVVLFTPWAGDHVRSGFTITAHRSGTCWTESLATGRPDAWRCMSGNAISDPCFAGDRGQNVVACVSDPFSRDIILMRLIKPLPPRVAATTGTRGNPWAMRLSNGATCISLTGATGAYAGERINYGCVPKGYVAGSPDRSARIWRALFLSEWRGGNATGPAKKIAIVEAIF